ncbi:ATP-binding cassette domain-containing protein [Candidatus Dojkabacteria bacterium]|nr:ATP-binding cassette domain-containing protein [Candidatus Dojkabacteria bacterium]
MFSVKNLTVKVHDSGGVVLNNISFSIESGQKLLILGPNGSGKSSLVKAILGDPSYDLSEGEINFNEKKLNDLKPYERARLGIFIGYQNPVTIEGLSFNEFLFFSYLDLKRGRAGDSEVDDFRTVLEKKADGIGIDKRLLDRNVNEGLSGGEKKMMELLQMVIFEPKLVILDEPDSGLDSDSVKIIVKALGLLPKESSVILISHDPARIGLYDFDKVVVMKDTEIVKTNDTGANSRDFIKNVLKEGYKAL